MFKVELNSLTNREFEQKVKKLNNLKERSQVEYLILAK